MFNPLSNNERNFIDNCFKEEIRIDGRNKNDHRNIIIEKKEENGQIYLKLGETIILSQVFAKLINPGTDRQNEGVIVFNLDSNNLKPSAEFSGKSDELNDLRIKITNLLEKSLRDSKALDSQTLCIVPGKLAWKIVIDLNIVNNDGNLYDAIVLATFASWLTFKIPFLKKVGNSVNIPENPQMINLSCLHIPLSVTFGIFNDNTNFIVDPNLKEEMYVSGFVIISINKYKEVCYLNTYSEIKVERDMINDMLDIAKTKVLSLGNILNNFVNAERKKDTIINTKKTNDDKMDIDDDLSQYENNKKPVEGLKDKIPFYNLKKVK